LIEEALHCLAVIIVAEIVIVFVSPVAVAGAISMTTIRVLV
jgi:hypothetical protein